MELMVRLVVGVVMGLREDVDLTACMLQLIFMGSVLGQEED